MRRSILAALLSVTLAVPAAAEIHIRVVLDTSQSMLANDPARLAALSTLLLYDLAGINTGIGDSFEVIPFHPTQKWDDPDDLPPVQIGQPIQADSARRAALAKSLAKLPYDAKWTYFYPGLREAAADLAAIPGGANHVRVVVLVTDGLPEDPTRAEEERRIREELLPDLGKESIRLYVLAFGPKAYSNKSFFDSLVKGPGGASLGEVFVDPDGSRLLESMIEIFTRSFGYTQGAPQILPAGSLDLAGGETHPRVAVVLFWKQPQPPSLVLQAPRGGAVNAPGGVLEGRESGASYQMEWVLAPRPGPHPIAPMAPGAKVAVLRPSPLSLEIRWPRTGGPVSQVMAGKELELEVLVKPSAGGKGDPGEVDLSYQVHGERKAGGGYTWSLDPQAPPAWDQGKVVAEGRVYSIYPRYLELEDGRDFYVGHLEVTARKGATIVQTHRLEVYPLVAIAPVPLRGDAVPEGSAVVRALVRWERGCAHFRLDLAAGRLPQPVYSLQAVLPASTPTQGGLAGAFYTLDGLPLEISGGRPIQAASQWTRGRALKKDELLGEHEVCIQVGKPKTGDATRPFELPVELTLLKSPYDVLDVIKPFGFKVLIAPPGLVERWGARAALGLSLLGLLATFWYLRGRPDLPEDLSVAVGPADTRAGVAPQPLGEASLAARLLGLAAERPVFSEVGGKRLGVLKPFREGLYRFRPARGVRRLETPEGRTPEMTGDWAALSVHRTYRLWMGKEELLLRLEYQ